MALRHQISLALPFSVLSKDGGTSCLFAKNISLSLISVKSSNIKSAVGKFGMFQ